MREAISVMAKGTVLVIEDDEDILELVRYTVAKEGYDVAGVPSGEEGLALARQQLRTRLVGPHFEPDTRVTCLGRSLALPVMGSSTAGLGGRPVMDEGEFCTGAVQGCLEAGTLRPRAIPAHLFAEGD